MREGERGNLEYTIEGRGAGGSRAMWKLRLKGGEREEKKETHRKGRDLLPSSFVLWYVRVGDQANKYTSHTRVETRRMELTYTQQALWNNGISFPSNLVSGVN